MRHNKKFNHLGRKAAHRHAMLSNMACSLIMHKRISTTLAKAKALRMYVEPLLTHAKEDTTANRRLVFAKLKQKTVDISQFGMIVETDEAIGRKLDFLVQEMNREVNTIGSKANDAKIAIKVVEMKSLLEKIKEQVQNIE